MFHYPLPPAHTSLDSAGAGGVLGRRDGRALGGGREPEVRGRRNSSAGKDVVPRQHHHQRRDK